MTTSKGVNRTFLVMIGIYLGGSLLWGFLSGAIMQESSIYLNILVSQGLVIIPFLVYLKHTKTKITQLIPLKKISLSDALLCVVLTYLFYPVVVVVNLLSMFFVDSATADLTDQMLGNNGVLLFVFTAMIPAFVEEFICRGVIYQTYRKSGILMAMVLSAIMFGCMHMNFNQCLYTIVFGCALVMIVEVTGSIWSSVICHMVLNGTSVIMTQIIGKVEGMSYSATEEISKMQMEPEMMLVGLLCWCVIAAFTLSGAVVIGVHIAKKNHRLEEIKARFAERSKEKIVTIPWILGILICVGFMILSEIAM